MHFFEGTKKVRKKCLCKINSLMSIFIINYLLFEHILHRLRYARHRFFKLINSLFGEAGDGEILFEPNERFRYQDISASLFRLDPVFRRDKLFEHNEKSMPLRKQG
jgi:hypothetical protein